jgi:hypothetical protein
MFGNRPLIFIKEFTHLCLGEPDGFIFHPGFDTYFVVFGPIK